MTLTAREEDAHGVVRRFEVCSFFSVLDGVECVQGLDGLMSSHCEKSLIVCTFLKNVLRFYVLLEVRCSHAYLGALHNMLNNVP